MVDIFQKFKNTEIVRLLIAQGPSAYRSKGIRLSLAGRLLIARRPSAYRSKAVRLSLEGHPLIARYR